MFNNFVSRARWHFMRTPAAHGWKMLARVACRSAIARRRALAHPPSQAIASRVAEFDRNGFAMVGDLLDPSVLENLLAAAQTLQAQAPKEKPGVSAKKLWARLLDEEAEAGRLTPESPFVAPAVQPQAIELMSAIFGEVPRLDSVLLTLSEYTGPKLAFSQLWHRDFDDTRVVKLFVYLSDAVEDADGPFTLLPGPASDPVRYSRRSHRGDAEMKKIVELTHRVAIRGPKLTAFIVETSRCQHMGSRVDQGHSRLLYTATFFRAPRLYPEPALRIRATGTESASVRALVCPD